MVITILDDFEDLMDLIKHKLDIAGVSYTGHSSSLNQLTNDLQYLDGGTPIHSIPNYATANTLVDKINLYANFLESIVTDVSQIIPASNSGFTSMVNLIKFNPTVTLTSSTTNPAVNDSVTLTATVTYNNNAVSGVPVVFKDSNDNTLGTSTTNSSGVATYSFTYNSPVTVKAVTSTTDHFSSVFSGESTIGANILYAPLLDGSENVLKISGADAVFSNNRMYKGANILTEGWDNSDDWVLTFTAYLEPDNGQGVVVKSSTSNRRDNEEIIIYNHSSKGLIITTYGAEMNRDYIANSSQLNGTVDISVAKTTTEGTTQYTVTIGSYTSPSFTHNALTSSSRVRVGTDYWSGNNSVYITNILVVAK